MRIQLCVDRARWTGDATIAARTIEALGEEFAAVCSVRYVARFLLLLACPWIAVGTAVVSAETAWWGGSAKSGQLYRAPQAEPRLALVSDMDRDESSRDSQLPIADCGPDISALTGAPIAIDGSGSYDPGGQRITFHWAIVQMPEGSVAALDATDPAPIVVPQRAGSYRLQLVVSNEDGLESLECTTNLVAFDERPAPNARAGHDRTVRVGSFTRLDASASFDPMKTPLGFRWSLISRPARSRLTDADVLLRDSPTPLFTPDVPGRFVFRLEASNGDRAGQSRVTITAASGNLPPTADAGKYQFVSQAGAIVLDGSASFDADAGPSALGFVWNLVARPAASTLTTSAILDADRASAQASLDAPGAYVFRLNVTDGGGGDASNVLVRLAPDPTNDDAKTKPAFAAAEASVPPARVKADQDPPPLPDFVLTITPSETRIAAGTEGSATVSVRAIGQGMTTVVLAAASLPGIATALDRLIVSVGDSTTLRLKVAADTAQRTYAIAITAVATINGVAIRRSASMPLLVGRPLLAAAPPTTCSGTEPPVAASTVFVEPAGQDSRNCGRSAVTACASIQNGIENCASSSCNVVVKYGLYVTTTTIKLRNGVNVYGSCTFGGLSGADPAAANYRTVIAAGPPTGSPAISGESINSPTVVQGLVVLGKDETAAGQPSIAMAVSQSTGISLQRSVLVAGTGGAGVPAPTMAATAEGIAGNAPTPTGQQATTTGGTGGLACASSPPPSVGRGGKGADQQVIASNADCGDYYCTCTNANPNDSFGRAGNGNGPGTPGGAGGAAAPVGCGCEKGTDNVPAGPTGDAGAPGACGIQGGFASDPFGSFQGINWQGIAAAGGGGASAGGGGGGGGSGGMSAYTDASSETLLNGLPGGGGGGGGCGGAGGAGGGQGGASIALILNASTLAGTPALNIAVPGHGGSGGGGGQGGVGGLGGPGAAGTKGEWFDVGRIYVCTGYGPGSGGAGGSGGQGGAGSGGAGGSGGPSLGIALVGGSPDPAWQGIYSGYPGAPGALGSGGQNAAQPVVQPNPCKGADGSRGFEGANLSVLDVNKTWPSPARVVLPGQRIYPPGQLSSPNGTATLSMQDNGNLCLYVSGKEAWCSDTVGLGTHMVMQTDGNLVVYASNGSAPFASHTVGHPNSFLAVQDNGKLVIYDGLTPLWTKP